MFDKLFTTDRITLFVKGRFHGLTHCLLQGFCWFTQFHMLTKLYPS